MKLFAFLAVAEASVWIHPQVRAQNRAMGIPMEELPGVCFFQCTGDLAREEIRCGKHELDSPEYNQCMQDAEDNWEQCIMADGCIQADGTCANRCIPQAEADFMKCEDDFNNGLITQIEFVKCITTAEVNM